MTYEKIKEKISHKQKRKVSPYYGCLLLRPYEELEFDDPENPSFISDIISLVGDEVVEFPSYNECCGSYLLINRDKEDIQSSRRISLEAKEYGSEFLITSCPLCYFAINKAQEIPVKYFTEYLADKLGIE